MIFDGTSFQIDWGYTPIIEPAIDWKQWSDGNFRGRDRTAAEDVHRSRFSLTGTYAQLTTLVNQLVVYRTYPTITCSVGEEIFGPHIDYSSSIDVNVDDFGELKRKSFSIYSLEILVTMIGSATSRYIAGTTSTTTFRNDIYSLKSVDYDATMTTDVTTNNKRSYSGLMTYLDKNTDMGICKIRVSDFSAVSATPKLATVAKALLKDVRTTIVTWPGIGQSNPVWGPTYPFGPRGPATPYTNIIEWKFGPRTGPRGWTMDLTFAQALFNFDGT